jgi:predicted alpha/beta-hydrolase family hydrolase
LILSHGAGGNAQATLLRALAATFADAGFTVLRCNLPFRQARSFGPPGPADAARDRAGLKSAIAALQQEMANKETGALPLSRRTLAGNRGDFDPNAQSGQEKPNVSKGSIYLAGHSYGGRQSSMLCAEEPDVAAGLLLLSYPLHPPRRSEQQRTQHLPDLRTPTLFVHGTRDPFGTIEEVQRAIKMIPATTKLLTVEGAGHDLGFKGKGSNSELPTTILKNFYMLVE